MNGELEREGSFAFVHVGRVFTHVVIENFVRVQWSHARKNAQSERGVSRTSFPSNVSDVAHYQKVVDGSGVHHDLPRVVWERV